jgi:hypothetical protein
MAITDTSSAQLGNDVSALTGRKTPIDDHGKLRVAYGKVTQGAAAGDDGSTVQFLNLPPGRIRILPQLSRVVCSALGAARVLKVGHALYYDKGIPQDDAGEAADDDALAAGIDVSAAAEKTLAAAPKGKFDIFSRAGVRITGTVTGGTIPAAATLELILVYVAE